MSAAAALSLVVLNLVFAAINTGNARRNVYNSRRNLAIAEANERVFQENAAFAPIAPTELSSDMRTFAANAKEFRLAYLAAGFSSEDAAKCLAEIAIAQIAGP